MTRRYGHNAVRVLLAVMEQPGASIREIADRLGLAGSTVQYHLQALRQARCVDWVPRQDGTLRALVRMEPLP